MKFYVISEEEALDKGVKLDGRDEIFDYISVETMEDNLEDIYENKYHFTEEVLEKAKDYVIYEMENSYNTDLVIDTLIEKGILS